MKSAKVAGKAVPPQVCHASADAAGAAAVQAGGRARGLARARAAATAAVPRAVPKTIHDLAGEAMRRLSSVLRPPSARAWVIEPPPQHARSVAGYAARPRGAATATPGAAARPATSASSASSASGDWGFLDDSRLSIEEKLFRFMKLVMKKSDDELVEKMKALRSGKASGSSASGASQSKSSGGLFGFLKQAFPPLASLEKLVPALPGFVNQVASQLGPQLLGALMIPAGLPWAAPLVQRAASALLPALDAEGGSASASGTSGSNGSTGSSGLSKESDERLQLMEIERLVQKTNQMFATVSNILKATHDAAMTAVNNIR